MDTPTQDGIPSKKDRFLDAFAALGNITAAAKMAGCNRQAHYNWMKEDPEYPRRFADAKAQANDRIDGEIIRRGMYGIDEPVFRTAYNKDGKPVGTEIVGYIRRYSDQLLIAAAKANMPEKYRERHEHSGQIDGPPVNLFQLILEAKKNPPKVISSDGYEMVRGPNGELLLPGPDGKGEEIDDRGD